MSAQSPPDELSKYVSMRDFSRTPEPSGGQAEGSTLSFVVQKHAATALHYDFRLQVGDVMPSWAVPKGPSYNPKVRRLAIQTEDHPLDYQTFEGVIPRGEYGGGQVIIWDRGTYERVSTKPGQPLDMRKSIEAGHFTVMLHGEKLIGQWSLIRTGESKGKAQWVMLKHKDEYVDETFDVTKERPESVTTGRTIDDLKNDGAKHKRTSINSRSKEEHNATRDAEPQMPRYVTPMLAQQAKNQTPDNEWVFERKFDGLRCLAVRNGNDITLFSRNELSFNKRFPYLVDALRALPLEQFVLDGELVAFDDQGRTSFSRLQQDAGRAEFHVFDLIHLLGQDTTSLDLTQRQALLRQAVEPNEDIKVVDRLNGTASDLLQQACRNGWEGIIAKRPDSKYVSGRSPNWIKLKCTASQELVIGGWTEPQGSRLAFGALLLGYYDDSGFRYAGKVGTGFNADSLNGIFGQLRALNRKTSPFVDAIKEKTAHWVTPHLVASISFTEWTRDGRLRHPSFDGLRPDKNASEVRREQ